MAVTKAGETIFSAVSGRIIQQLKVRENFTSSNTKNITDLAALNQNTGWIKVSSGSNILSRDGQKTYSGPAQRFILHGGASLSKSQAQNKNVDTHRKGINFDKGTSFANSGNAYNNYNDRYGLGIRPMPGITSFNLQTYNPYGTLRQADITFTVWTLDDLEQAEKLFLRPGFTCVIEFGHSVYQDNDGNLQTFGKTVNTISEDFLFSERTIESVEEAIENKRDEAFGNYDAFFGYVSNFSYSFRPDGGYDCSMKVVSKGVILDSLLGGETSDNASITPTNDENKANDSAIPKHKSIFHTIFRAISEYLPDPNSESGFTATLDTVLEECLENGEEIELFARLDTQDQCKFIYADITDPTVNQEDGNENLKATERLSYIPLRFVLDIFNKFASIYKIGDTKRKTPLVKFSLEFGNKFRTFDKHFSVTPSNVHLPKRAPQIEHPDKLVYYGMTADAADAAMEDYGGNNNSDGNGKNEILNIFISTKILLSIADQVYDTGGVKDKTIIDFINGVLTHINTALSDVCKLSLYYNESLNEYEVVDLHGIGKAGAVPIINVTGLKSTVKGLSIQSRLSTTTAAQISIAAQGSVDNYKENVRAIRNWNLGSVDRFYPTKTVNPGNTVKTEITSETESPGTSSIPYQGNIVTFFKTSKELYSSIGRFFDDLKFNSSLDSNAEKDLQQSLRKVCLILYEIAQANKKGTTVRHEVPIPVELSITMKGISGMKIGQVFKINKGVLLPKYNRYGYVITGIENKLDSNEWTTEIVTQFFELDNL